ncbi:MAG TPA: isoleucine--tRNA ligase [Chitinophagales bacterium]|nr:isoleucine--tRNA ligase [Chitinophagales bacterium]HNJ59786.1 isoleucine--tRNA ligase [Chitinophagales bacterium]
MSNTDKKFYKEYKQFNPTEIEQSINAFWKSNDIFKKSITQRNDSPNFVFYEGPPSANGMPGIHHVMARAIKDIFCRFKTIQGYKVNRKAGWDTHGLPIELQVEKSLGITKKDIGTKISVEDYNKECRKEVMKFKDKWDELTDKIGYWVDLDNPYITYENEYIESVWWLISELYKKGYLYKGLKIQPYSPAAGTGLSSHELNQPGCYRDVKDTTAVACFKLKADDEQLQNLFSSNQAIYCLAWTTTPWTLPSNTALAVGKNIDYVLVNTINPYSHQPMQVILAKNLLGKYFSPENENANFSNYQNDGKNLPYSIVNEVKGSDLAGINYEQLLPFVSNSKEKINGVAFKIILGDFVTTEDGTGIVHIAPSFGADDMKVANENGIGGLTLVDKEGKFVDGTGEFSGRYVKDYKDDPNYISVDIDIAVKLKKENKAFKVEKHEHSYPHCWRTDKPIIYYPLDSWFIKVTAAKDRLIELNKTINWKPESTGTGRFGQWLENLVDWNLSRTRFWGTPLNIWRTEDGTEEKCISSIEELQTEIKQSIDKGFLPASFLEKAIDLHKPYVDEIILVSALGSKMYREADLIDVWFDSGAMPYAQIHYPFSGEHLSGVNFPADFIAEGVDQTRGWFYTLHAIATMLFDSVAYKNVVSNGLVLDKNGNKMSKRLGNAVDPFITIAKYGADAVRWYMVSNGQPWDNLKFDIDGVLETQRKLFSTLYNTYNFFAIYANVDAFAYKEQELVPYQERAEIDKWILSRLNSLIDEVAKALEDYEPTKAARAIEAFVVDDLSNWYVRLCRRRFWDTEASNDKNAAFQTLFECMLVTAQLMSPIAPFFSDWLYNNLVGNESGSELSKIYESVHLVYLPKVDTSKIDTTLEQRMDYAKNISSLVLSLRKKTKIKVRQPLQKILIPNIDIEFINQIDKVKDLILSEVNVKEIEYISDTSGIISKKVKPNFKLLGKKLGGKMKLVADEITQFGYNEINTLEQNKKIDITVEGATYEILLEEVEIISDDIQGWLVANERGITVALDITITENLKNEGFAREIVNKIQSDRKEQNFNVADKIQINVQNHLVLNNVINKFKDYICNETLCESIDFSDNLADAKSFDINDETLLMTIKKI